MAAMWLSSFLEKDKLFLTNRDTRCLKVQLNVDIDTPSDYEQFLHTITLFYADHVEIISADYAK